jgi:hypothetical protein
MVGVGLEAREETRDPQTCGVMELFARSRGSACPVDRSAKQPMYA